MSDNSPTPDGSELSSSYRILAANTIDNTFSLRQLLTEQDSRSINSPKVFADVLAVTTMKAYAGMHPENETLSATTFEEKLGDGTTSYNVSLRDRLGGGITYVVNSNLSVGMTPVQGLPNGQQTRTLETDTFRWNGHGGEHDGYLEHALKALGSKAPQATR